MVKYICDICGEESTIDTYKRFAIEVGSSEHEGEVCLQCYDTLKGKNLIEIVKAIADALTKKGANNV